MNKRLFDLLALQEVDMKIRGLKTRLTMIPKEREDNEKKLALVSAALKVKQDKLKNTELALRTTEADIAQLNESIRKLQVNSAMVKKNNEYQAMLTEIQHLKDKISDQETRQLELMDLADVQRNEVKEAEKQSSARIKSIKDELEEFTVLEKEIKEQGRALVTQSKEFAARIDSELLGRYQRLLKTDGIPVSKLNGDICGNCRFKITPQTRNACRSGTIVNCDNCAHMLYSETSEE